MSERYRVIRTLGTGGMAEVFLAAARGEEGFEKPVVIKRLHAHLSRQETVGRMFLSEARLAMHLNHQNVVQVLDVGRGPEGLYLVMELVNGWDLSVIAGHAKQRGYPSETTVAYIASQVAAGLAHAFKKTQGGRPLLHAHRDISPSNILVSVEGEVKVADFGIARVEESGATDPGSFKGKVPFAAPEVVRGLPATSASDQFSLGVVLYRLLGQGHPYGHTDNLVQYAEILSRAPAPKVEFASPPFRKILLRLLALRPEDRYPSWDDVSRDLGLYLSQSGAPSSSGELARYLGTLGLGPPPLEVPVAAAPTPSRSSAPVDEEFELQSDWQPVAALDASGRVSRVAPPPGAAPLPRMAAIARDEEPDDSPPIQALPVEDEPLQLAERPPPPPSVVPPGQSAFDPTPGYQPLPGLYDAGPPAKKRRSLFPAALAFFVLLIAGAAAAVLILGPPKIPRGLVPRSVNLPAALEKPIPVLTIESIPSGATVLLNDVEVGETPFAKENDYAEGARVNVKVLLRGYRPWTGTFVGGAEANLEAKLQRR